MRRGRRNAHRPPSQYWFQGWSLLELLLTLTIAAILSGLAYPNFNAFVARTQTTTRINDLITLIRFARHAAVTEQRWVGLCPAVGDRCTGSASWETGIMVFADGNRDGERQPGEALLAYQPALGAGERLQWRAFRSRNYLQFRPRGYTNWQNGTFLYCPADGDVRYAKGLILNIQGRTALTRDADGDGVDERANGTPIRC
ncbi:MAG: GspH/FimT family pseudopilin [Pseudomonadota bacterium]